MKNFPRYPIAKNRQKVKELMPETGQFFDNMGEWLTTEEAASFLRVSPKVLLNLCSNGALSYYKLGRSNRYKKEDLQDLLIKRRSV